MSDSTLSTLTNTTPTSDPIGVLSAGADDPTGFGRAYRELETQIRAVPMAELLFLLLRSFWAAPAFWMGAGALRLSTSRRTTSSRTASFWV